MKHSSNHFFFLFLTSARVISPLRKSASSSRVSGIGAFCSCAHTSSGSFSANGFLKLGGRGNGSGILFLFISECFHLPDSLFTRNFRTPVLPDLGPHFIGVLSFKGIKDTFGQNQLVYLVSSFCRRMASFSSFFSASGSNFSIFRSTSCSLSFDRLFSGIFRSSKESGLQFFFGIRDIGIVEKQYPNVMNYCCILFVRTDFILRYQFYQTFLEPGIYISQTCYECIPHRMYQAIHHGA